MTEALVLCDLDGTLISGSSELVFLKGLIRRHRLSSKALLFFMLGYACHPAKTLREGKGWNRGYLRGLPASVLIEESNMNTRILLNMVRPSVMAFLKEMEGSGARVFLLSASVSSLVQGISEEIGFAGSVGSVPQIHRGVCTGRIEGERPWGKGKVLAAIRLLQELSMAPEEIMAIGDSWSDRHLMDICGNAVAVAPGSKLGKLASERGWRIIEN